MFSLHGRPVGPGTSLDPVISVGPCSAELASDPPGQAADEEVQVLLQRALNPVELAEHVGAVGPQRLLAVGLEKVVDRVAHLGGTPGIGRAAGEGTLLQLRCVVVCLRELGSHQAGEVLSLTARRLAREVQRLQVVDEQVGATCWGRRSRPRSCVAEKIETCARLRP